jgi:hypothetical protein
MDYPAMARATAGKAAGRDSQIQHKEVGRHGVGKRTLGLTATSSAGRVISQSSSRVSSSCV